MSSAKPGAETDGTAALRSNYLSLAESLAQTLGSMAPSGGLAVIIPLVFVNAGNGTWLLYVLTIAAYLFLAVNLNVFAVHSASAGGLAAYPELGLGRWAGPVAGWCYLATLVFALASAAPSAAFYGGLVLERQLGVGTSPAFECGLTAVFIVAAWWAAHRDVRLSTDVMLVIECLSIGAMLTLAVAYMVHTGRWIDRPQLRLDGVTPRGMRMGLVLALMSLTGFETVTTFGAEAKQALSTIPRAIATCLAPIGLLYLVMSYVLTSAFRGNSVSLDQSNAPFDQVAAQAGWPAFSVVISIGVTLSFFACLLGCLNAASRILYSMALRRHACGAFGTIHPRNGTPARAVAVIASVSLAIPVAMLAWGVSLGDCIGYLSQLASIGFVGSYLLVCVAVPFYLKRVNRSSFKASLASFFSLAILGYALISSVYPAPPPPWNFLPYIFAGVVCAGLASTALLSRGAASAPA